MNDLRIANLILAHKNPKQLSYLVRALACPEMDCYIHLDKKANLNEFVTLLGDLPQVFFIRNRVNIKWAGYGTIQATLNGFGEIMKRDIYYDYFHVMSGQDYPIKSNSFILNFVKANYGKEFFDIIHHKWPSDIATRYTRYHLVNSSVPGKYRLSNIVSALLPDRRFLFSAPVWGSSNWFMVTSACAKYLFDQINQNRSLRRFFKLVWGADEFIFINILRNSPFKSQICNQGIHFMEWEEDEAHAKVLTIRHLDCLTQSDKLFARKLDITVDVELINKLNHLNGLDS